MTETLDLLRAVARRRERPNWRGSLQKLAEQRAHYERLLQRPDTNVYGGNTQVGHRTGQRVDAGAADRFQRELIRSHRLGGPPFFSADTARCILYAKCEQVAAGGSGISADLFEQIIEAAIDETLRPAIPMSASYSSGDVIPGAHFATELLTHNGQVRGRQPNLLPGEGLALISGSFIHAGACLAVLRKLYQTHQMMLDALAGSLGVCLVDPRTLCTPPDADSELETQIASLKSSLETPNQPRPIQGSISFRATVQLLDAVTSAGHTFDREIDRTVRQPSCNPLIFETEDVPLAQASFLAPNLAIASSRVAEAWVFAAWASVGRVSHLLSGRVDGIPQDASFDSGELGLIQLPKLMTAWLEELRGLTGQRPFSSGGATSYGIEDLWTHGVQIAVKLDQALDLVQNILSCEHFATDLILAHRDATSPAALDNVAPDNLSVYREEKRRTYAQLDIDKLTFVTGE